MKDVVIENPIINLPYREPLRHFRFSEEGITNDIVEDRRSSSYFVPIAKPKKKGKQLALSTEWTEEVATARTLWVPAVNNHGGFCEWGFIEITDPWDAINTIRAARSEGTTAQ